MVDQSSKAWAVRALRFGDDKQIIKGLLDLIYTENPGIAFGQLQEGGAVWTLVLCGARYPCCHSSFLLLHSNTS